MIFFCGETVPQIAPAGNDRRLNWYIRETQALRQLTVGAPL